MAVCATANVSLMAALDDGGDGDAAGEAAEAELHAAADLVFAASAAAEANLARALHDGGAPAAEVLQKIEYSVGLRRELLMRASAGGAAAARVNYAQALANHGSMLIAYDDITAGRRVLLSALQAGRAAAHVPTLRAVLTNLINLGGGGVPILGGAADGDEAEGEEGAAVADAAISRAETDGFVEELDALLARGGRQVESECSICLAPLRPDGDAAADEAAEPVCVLGCSHRFHRRCIVGWSRRDARCPQCMAPMAS